MTRSYFRLAALVGAVALTSNIAFARSLTLEQVPAPVKRTADTELKNGSVKNVQSLEHNGRTIYEITLETPAGSNKVIYLEANGAYVNDQSFKPATATKELTLTQLPEAVRRTINTETKNGPVSKVEQMAKNGQPIYEVFFREPNGQEKTIFLNPDGSYVKDATSGRGTAGTSSSATSSGQGVFGTHSWDRVAAGSRQPLSSPSAVAFNQLPKPVQQAFQNEAGTTALQSIERGTLNGKTVYEGAFMRAGQPVRMRVTPDGSVVQDAQDSRIMNGGPLMNAHTVAFGQVPAAVQSAIRNEAGGANVESVRQGQVNGQNVYEAIVNHNGQPTQVRISATGTVMSLSRPATSFLNSQP